MKYFIMFEKFEDSPNMEEALKTMFNDIENNPLTKWRISSEISNQNFIAEVYKDEDNFEIKIIPE